MSSGEEKLDNPVWHSLNETHKDFAIDFDHTKFYHPNYCAFGGSFENGKMPDHITQYAHLVSNFFMVGEKPNIPINFKIKNELVGLQMLSQGRIDRPITEEIIKLEADHEDDLLQLVRIVYPEYFKKKTASLGNYYGIYKNSQLVAVTGERMQMNEYIEVSAVITHPNHTGNGYAKQLVSYTVNGIYHQKKTPYLHVAETNAVAINLYETLGFHTRRKISFWKIGKDNLPA